jgi:Rrf2 family protein
MFGYGKMSGTAIAAVSALAENHQEGAQLNSQQISEQQNLSQALVAKVLTVLSQAGFVLGTRGPGGGYRLARDPSKITMHDVVEVFEGHKETTPCPFGPGWCGIGEPCPMHNDLEKLREANATKLKKFHFGVFAGHGRNS